MFRFKCIEVWQRRLLGPILSENCIAQYVFLFVVVGNFGLTFQAKAGFKENGGFQENGGAHSNRYTISDEKSNSITRARIARADKTVLPRLENKPAPASTAAYVVQEQESKNSNSRRMVVPDLIPRPRINPQENKGLTQREAGDDSSIAGLIKNVQGQDAVIEIILGRSKILTLQESLTEGNQESTAVVAVSDPAVIDFEVLPNARMIRIFGKGLGSTDLSVITSKGQSYNFEIKTVFDIPLLNRYVRKLFPDVNVQISQMDQHLLIEGEVSSQYQEEKVIGFLQSVFSRSSNVGTSSGQGSSSSQNGTPVKGVLTIGDGLAGIKGKRQNSSSNGSGGQMGGNAGLASTSNIINLLRIKGMQQVMLKVRVAEVDRNALRTMGTSLLVDNADFKFASSLGSATPAVDEFTDLIGLVLGSNSTATAVFPTAGLTAVFDALKANRVASILAEPNLTALHGEQASFLAGGEFPVQIPQAGGNSSTFTVEYKEFGVALNFTPYIMGDGVIRLKVAPEVSTIEDTLGVNDAPLISTRRANTTVELRQGQTLALAGILQVEVDAQKGRLPGLSDLPLLGPLFGNAKHNKDQRELVILATPYLVSPMNEVDVPPLPGSEIVEPTDTEFYLRNRIEGGAQGYVEPASWNEPASPKPKSTTRGRGGILGLFR